MRPCTPMEESFLQKYIELGNASEALRQSLYSTSNMQPQTINIKATQILKKPPVKARLDEMREELATKSGITRERILEEYAKLGFSSITDFVDWKEGTAYVKDAADIGDKAACISEIVANHSETGGQIKVKLHDKKGALDSAARVLGMFNDKLEVKSDPFTQVLIDMGATDRHGDDGA